MLTLNDGRAELWQWDTGRTLTVDADCSQVHFSNKVFGRSIDVDVIDGSAIIPDVLLQTDKDLNVWAFVGTAENGYTKISKTFKVNRRNKPADYVFTPQEQILLKDAITIAETAKSSATAAVSSAAAAESSAQAAKGSADDAANSAEAARSSASAASESSTAAGLAKSGAEKSANAAAGSATAANEEAVKSAASAAAAEKSRKAAGESETKAADSADAAAASATLAQQAANSSGYMQLGIDEAGHLIYKRTSNLKEKVKFSIVDDTNLEVSIYG